MRVSRVLVRASWNPTGEPIWVNLYRRGPEGRLIKPQQRPKPKPDADKGDGGPATTP